MGHWGLLRGGKRSKEKKKDKVAGRDLFLFYRVELTLKLEALETYLLSQRLLLVMASY